MQVGELFIALGFDVDDSKLKSFNDGIKSSMVDLLKLTGIAAGAVYSVNKFIESSLHNSVALRQFTAETGESAEALKKWQIAAQLANTEIEIDEVTSAFKRMNSAIAAAQYSGEKGGVFAQLGIENIQSKTSAELLNELRQNFQMNIGRWGLPKTLDFMEQLGVPKSMARTFELSDEDIDRMTRGLTVTKEQNKAITDLADKLRHVSLEWQHFKDITTAEYSDELITFIENASSAVKTFSDNMKSLFYHSESYSGGLKLMAGGFALIVAALSPMVATVAALAVALNDLGALSRGEKTITGRIINAPLTEMKRTTLEESIANWKSYLGVGGGSNGVTMNNTYNIQSTADPHGVAQEVVQQNQLQLNRAYSGLNRGGF